MNLKKRIKKIGIVICILVLGGTAVFAADMDIEKENGENVFSDEAVLKYAEETGYSHSNIETRAAGKPGGIYPRKPGAIVVCQDRITGKGYLGHSGIVYSYGTIIDSDASNGVASRKNNWWKRTKTVGMEVNATSNYGESLVAEWAYKQRGKDYDFNFYNIGTRSKFYCSQLIWAGYIDLYKVDLNSTAFGAAIHPYEFRNSRHTDTVYIK